MQARSSILLCYIVKIKKKKFNLIDALAVRNILTFYIQILSQFVIPPSDAVLRYFNMFHLAP
jgi:hypothetical protein